MKRGKSGSKWLLEATNRRESPLFMAKRPKIPESLPYTFPTKSIPHFALKSNRCQEKIAYPLLRVEINKKPKRASERYATKKPDLIYASNLVFSRVIGGGDCTT